MVSSRVTLCVVMVMLLGKSAWSRNCPYGWFDRPNSNTCYFFTKNSATNTWEDARLKCTSSGGDLVSISSQQEWNYITTTMEQLYNSSHHQFQHWWIGLNRRDDGSTWKWPDGSIADNSILTWRPNAPKSDKTKNCVQFYLFKLGVGSCTNAVYQSICSRPKGLPIQCDADGSWQHYHGKCYKYFNTARTWNDASQSCRTVGATLPKISDLTTETIVADFTRQHNTNLWTGLRSRGKPNAIQWVWQDGTLLATNPYWMPRQPPNNMNTRISTTCVELNSHGHLPSTWVVNNCAIKRKYYCQKPEGKCADGWREYGSMCYQFNKRSKISWNKAQAFCHGQGGNLAAITSSNIQNFLNQYLRAQYQFGVRDVWIGLTDNNKDGGPWKFTSGATPANTHYNNWIGAPRNTHGKQDCVYITTSDRNGKWRVTSSCVTAKSFICQIKTNIQVKQITQPPTHYICSDNWLHNGAFCYMFNEQDKSYDNARSWCQQQGADLARITDASVQSFINSKLGNGGYWIGLNDRHHEGWYTWLDDTTTNATYYNWNAHQPDNNGGKENCVHVIGNRAGRWNDNQCKAVMNFICEKAAKNAYSTPPTTTPKPWSSKCGPFWSSNIFTPFCYQFSDEKLTWFDARARCQSHGGDLASIETSEESYFLAGQIRTMNSVDYWIAANDQGTEGGWKWADGRPFAFLNWNAGEPNDVNHAEDCAATLAKTGRWQDQGCNLRKGYICKSAEYFQCDSGWTEFKHNCYNLNHKKSTWQNARNWCKSQHSDLVKIGTLDVLGFVRDHVDGSGDWWIGLNDIHTEGTFVWLDNKQPGGVIQWKPGEPNQQGNEDCVAIFMTRGAQNGFYNDYVCSMLNNFICKKPARKVDHTSMPQTTTPKSVPAGSIYGCPLNWRGFRGSCYSFAWNTGTYDNSIQQCGYRGSKLASIIDDAENKFVFSMIPKSLSQPNKVVWIGLNDRSIEMKYVWLDGERVTYTKWANNEPNNWQGHDEDCVAMYTQNGLWNDQVCTDKMAGAVCKRPKAIIPNSQMEIGNGCQTGQIGYHTTCYQFRWNPTKTWSDAEKDCVSHKGHLATIPGRHVQAFLGAEMLNKGSTWWVGISDIQTPGQYLWSSGQPFSFSAWYETHTGNERSTCVGVRSGHPAGLWENHNCTDHRSYICEYPRTGYTTLPTTPTTTPSPLPCPNSWTAFNGICYKLFGGLANLKTWTAARDICQGYGGDLVSIHNSSLEAFLITLVPVQQQASFWIGLNDRDVENGYQWTDQSPFSYSNWASGEPNNFNTQEDCVEFNPTSKSWNDFYCYADKQYLCQLRKGVQITTTPTPPVGSTSPLCVGNGTWYFYNNNCYKSNPANGTDSQKTWYDARRYCMAQGGDLASIHSPDDNGFINSMVSVTWRKDLLFWIGLNNLDMSGYQWADASPVQFLAWNIRQPDDGQGEKRCVYFRNARGAWFDENCNDVMGFICQKRPLYSQPRTPPPTANIPGGCHAGFSTFFGSNRCYMVGGQTTGRLNWTNANTYCQQQAAGANLAIIITPLENKFVVTLMSGLSIQAWVGMKDKQMNGRYMWVDSTEVDYTAWAPGQPDEDLTTNKRQHRRDCVMVWFNPRGKYQAGGWDDYFCDSQKAFICSVPKITQGNITPIPNTVGCPQGYLRYQGSCYKGIKTPKTWQNAQTACQGDGGNLVSINGIFEASFVDLIMVRQGPSWIGLSNAQHHNKFTWSDNYPLQFTRWDYKEPSTAAGLGCVLQNGNYMWNNTVCSNHYNYICEVHVSGGPSTTAVVVGYCPDSTWTSGTDYCYKAIGTGSTSWPEARYMCQRVGAELASVNSGDEMAMIFHMLANNQTDIWIGLTKSADGGFMWTDRTPVGYLNWAQNEPSDINSKWHQDCVLMMAALTWQWNDLDCFTKAGYMCKILKSTSTYSTGTNPPVVTQTPQHQGQQTQPPQITQRHPQHTIYNPGHTQPQRQTIYNPYLPNHTLRNPLQNNVTPKPTSGQNTYNPHNTPAPLVNNPGTPSSGGGLSGGAIAGIIIGVIAILVLVAIAFLLARKKYNIPPNLPPMGFENALYHRHNDEVSVNSRNPTSMMYSESNEEDC